MKICIPIQFTLTFFITTTTMIISPCTPQPLAPALYVFGDSLVDSGNNNLLPTVAKANFYPYGANFARGPTGRFTNGKTVVDFIAEYLGLPLAPAYLAVRGLAKLTGMNYASGSCGILPDTGKSTGKCLSLGEQIELFETTIKVELPNTSWYSNMTSNQQISKDISEAVFCISIGSNDYINNYLLDFSIWKLYSPNSFSDLLIAHLSPNLERLYELGARKIVLFEIGPIGCIPSITGTRSHTGRCVSSINSQARLFNKKLARMIQRLRLDHPDSQLILAEVHKLGLDAFVRPSFYGLKESSIPCCTTWGNGTSVCIPTLEPCNNPDEYFFWDGFHLTEGVYKLVADRCIHDSSVCTPMNIKELVNV